MMYLAFLWSPWAHRVFSKDQVIGIEEGQDHMLGPVCVDLSLNWTRVTLWQPLPGLLFGLSSVK